MSLKMNGRAMKMKECATVQAANLALSTLGGRVDGVLASCATDGFTH